jgi:hypothetical protein
VVQKSIIIRPACIKQEERLQFNDETGKSNKTADLASLQTPRANSTGSSVICVTFSVSSFT